MTNYQMIPFEVGMTLKKAMEQEDDLKRFIEEDTEAEEVWALAIELEV